MIIVEGFVNLVNARPTHTVVLNTFARKAFSKMSTQRGFRPTIAASTKRTPTSVHKCVPIDASMSEDELRQHQGDRRDIGNEQRIAEQQEKERQGGGPCLRDWVVGDATGGQ